MKNCKTNTTFVYSNDENSKVMNEELNVFHKAKFGSKYVTRNGDIALFLCDLILIVSGTATPISYNQRGFAIGKDKGYDIVAKYNIWYKIRNIGKYCRKLLKKLEIKIKCKLKWK